MDGSVQEVNELHWLMGMLHSIDVGLVVLDREYRIHVWNGFMENHSGRRPDEVIGQDLFTMFPDLPQDWFRGKAESVFQLKSRAFTIWEQRPYLFRFKNYRPITGTADFMYQNITLIPLVSVDGEVSHIGVIVYDVTDTAVNRKALQAANDQLEALSRTDALTGLNNRGYWEECQKREFARARRTGQPVSLVMFDIDHFKAINDTYGHQAGDEVIRVVSETLRSRMRATDIAGRYGGEEFVVILIDTDAEGGRIMAERLRRSIEALSVRHEDHAIRFTVSLGVAELQEDIAGHSQWTEQADRALYRAKHEGRNRVVIAQPEGT